MAKQQFGKFRVGDIVICHGWEQIKGKKGFIEEIVSDPNPNDNKDLQSGHYSVYGLEKDDNGELYFGDIFGNDLEHTGKSMTKDELIKYAEEHQDDNSWAYEDMSIVIANLGRMSGENSLHRKNPAPVKKNSNTLGDSREAEEVRRELQSNEK